MREVVTLHFGQAGVQLGNATWELLCLEHGINEMGILQEEPRDIECLETFFSVSHKNYFVPRALYVDLEPSVIDEVRKGSYRSLFHPNRLISGPEDAASNFARGFFTVGKLILNKINFEFRKIMEGCDHVHGIIMFRGLGGGTGSGLMSAMLDCLAEYPKTYKLEVPIYPAPTITTMTVEPYNSLLAQHFCMEDIDIGLLFDNEAIYDMCMKTLGQSSVSYNMVNKLIAQVCSNLTVSLRFENTICSDLSTIQNNIVPYPRIHFPVCNYAPIMPASHAERSTVSISEMTYAVFNADSQLTKIDPTYGKMMSCALNYRGDISPYHVYIALMEMKSNKLIEFVDWCPTGFRVGINVCPPVTVPESCLAKTERSVTLLTNTSSIGQAWQRLTHKFYLLYSKKSFVHWFVAEGMEECEFTESLYNISSLIKDYEECVLDTVTDSTDKTTADSQSNKRSAKSSMKQSVNTDKDGSVRRDDRRGSKEEDCVVFRIEDDITYDERADTHKNSLNRNSNELESVIEKRKSKEEIKEDDGSKYNKPDVVEREVENESEEKDQNEYNEEMENKEDAGNEVADAQNDVDAEDNVEEEEYRNNIDEEINEEPNDDENNSEDVDS